MSNAKSLPTLARLSSLPPSSSTRVAAQPQKCPIPGCNMTFQEGTHGWAKHVSSLTTHPYWEVKITDETQRRDAFRVAFPRFFDHIRTRPVASSTMPPSSVSVTVPTLPVAEAPLTREDLKALFREVLREAIDKL